MSVRERRDIEYLVIWALRDQGLGWAGKERQQLDLSDYGTIIDDHPGGSHPTIALWSDDDAMAVKLGIDQLAPEARALVVQYGRAGLRPDWCEDGYGSYQQLRDGRGRRMWDWADPKNRTGDKRPRMGFVGEQRETVDYHRAQYQVWWWGLHDIVGPLNDVMERHEATGPNAPRWPWASDSGKPVVFGPDGTPIVDTKAKPMVSEVSLETRRARASDPLRGVATDWETPVVPIPRSQAR